MLPGGLNWPLDLAVGDDGSLYVADGTYFYAVRRRRLAADRRNAVLAGLSRLPSRAGACGPGEFVVATSGGQIARYRPGDGETDYLADGFDQLYGVAIGPGDTIVFAELGTGRVHALRSGNVEVLASGLQDPVGVAFGPDGSAAGGRIRRGPGGAARRARPETVVDGLQRPQGILVARRTALHRRRRRQGGRRGRPGQR